MTDRRRNIVGLRFPSVAGRALSGEVVHIPEDLAGAPVLLLCAYRRGTQADADRWAAFAERELAGLAVYELPIIPSLVWRPLQGWIDGGMRGGVPASLWNTTVTLYAQAAAARDFVGDSGGLRTQVVLLDGTGVVAFHDAGGFTESAAASLRAAVAALPG